MDYLLTIVVVIGILVINSNLCNLIKSINAVYNRLDRLPPRVIAKTIHGDEIYKND